MEINPAPNPGGILKWCKDSCHFFISSSADNQKSNRNTEQKNPKNVQHSDKTE